LGGFEKEERGNKRREIKGERREKRGKKGGGKIQIPKEKCKLQNIFTKMIIFFNFFYLKKNKEVIFFIFFK
jgi:hypothetical protein